MAHSIAKVTHPMYYKNSYPTVLQNEFRVPYPSLVQKKYNFKAKIDRFLNFKVINFLLRTIQCTEILIYITFAHENMKRTLSKAGYLEMFSTALTARSALNQQNYKIHLSFCSTWDI